MLSYRYIVLLFLGFLVSSCSNDIGVDQRSAEKKIGVVDVLHLIDKVEFKNDIYELKRPTFELYNYEKDSLLQLRQIQIKNKNTEEVRRIERQFNELQDNLEVLEDEYNQQVMNKLNVLIKEYAEENNYNAILGGTGNGGILYSDESMDITDDILKYINSQN